MKNSIHLKISIGYICIVMICAFLLRKFSLPSYQTMGVIPKEANSFGPLTEGFPSLSSGGAIRFIHNLTHPICLMAITVLSIFACFKVFPKLPEENKFLLSVSSVAVYSLLLAWLAVELFGSRF